MKSKIVLTIAVIAGSLIFNSCKKSENDPFLPFMTRDARITNTWNLKSLNKSIITLNELGFTDTKTYVFDGTEMTETHEDFFGTTTESTYIYSNVIDIQKGNEYKQTITTGADTYELNSFWYWHDSDKNKIGIIFDDGNTYIIKRLAKDELVLESSKYTVNTYENGDKSTYTYSELLTFNPQ